MGFLFNYGGLYEKLNQSINTFRLSVLILFLAPVFLPTFNSFLIASDLDCYDSCKVVPWFLMKDSRTET